MKCVKDGRIVWGFAGKHGEDITEGITTDDVCWLLNRLSGIGAVQLRLAFLASGATPAYADQFTRAILNRIAQLRQVEHLRPADTPVTTVSMRRR